MSSSLGLGGTLHSLARSIQQGSPVNGENRCHRAHVLSKRKAEDGTSIEPPVSLSSRFLRNNEDECKLIRWRRVVTLCHPISVYVYWNRTISGGGARVRTAEQLGYSSTEVFRGGQQSYSSWSEISTCQSFMLNCSKRINGPQLLREPLALWWLVINNYDPGAWRRGNPHVEKLEIGAIWVIIPFTPVVGGGLNDEYTNSACMAIYW